MNPYDNTDFNNMLINMLSNYNSRIPSTEESNFNYSEEEQDDNYDYYSELEAKLLSLEEKLQSYEMQNTVEEPESDELFDYIMNSNDDNTPVDWANIQIPQTPSKSIYNNSNLDEQISAKESGGDYTAINPNSSATGKYQFLWNTWKNKIKDVTGIQTRNDFRYNPEAQENFYSWYKQNELLPAVQRLQNYNKKGLSQDELAKLIHFKGEGGARKWLTTGVDNTRANNISIEKYIY